MTREELIDGLYDVKNGDCDGNERLHTLVTEAIKALEQELCDFAKWVAGEIFDDEWEYNKDAFAEIACRKLAKLGIVRAKGDEWELVEQEPCDNCKYLDGDGCRLLFEQAEYGKASDECPCEDAISRQAVIDAFHTWFRDGFDEDKWWNSTHVLAAIEGIPSVHQKHKWETCFDCPLSHGCPKIKGCTNEQAIEYASKIPNDCPLSEQPERKTDGDTISRQAVLDLMRSLTRWCVRSEDGKFNNVGLLYDDVMFGIDKLPPVNPQPKTGHWIKGYTFLDGNYWKCDKCNGLIKVKIPMNYCNNCGAKMVEL